MYEKDGEQYFIVDGHTHFWDARPENRNKWGEGFIACFYDYHRNLSPEEYVWPKEKYDRYTEEDMIHDLFEIGYVDKAIMQPTYLKEFFPGGFNTTEQDAEMAAKHPGKFIVNGSFDPRDGEAGLDELRRLKETYDVPGVKLYTAEWKGESRGWKLSDDAAQPYFALCEELGIKNIHVHKGPTIWPLNRDAFDVADVDHAATAFPNLNFIVEHCGLPRLEDFCWIGTQEPNVYGGLAVAMPFIYSRPRYFAQIVGELLLLARRRPDHVRQRLRDLAAQVAGRDVRRLPDPRGHAGRARRAVRRHQEEDPRPQRGQAVRHRRARRDARSRARRTPPSARSR